MSDWANPDSWMDVVDHLWIGVVLIVTAAVPTWAAHRNHKGIAEVRNQVQNGHNKTNLRDDLDRAICAVEALGHDVRCLRTDLMAEEDRRRIQIGDVRDELDRLGKRRNL